MKDINELRGASIELINGQGSVDDSETRIFKGDNRQKHTHLV